MPVDSIFLDAQFHSYESEDIDKGVHWRVYLIGDEYGGLKTKGRKIVGSENMGEMNQ